VVVDVTEGRPSKSNKIELIKEPLVVSGAMYRRGLMRMSMARLDNFINASSKSVRRQLGRSADTSLNRDLADVICGVTLVIADALAITLAGVAALFVIRLIQACGIEQGSARMSGDQLGAAAPELTMVTSLVLIYMILHGHFTRRLPFWTELGEIVEISLFALLTTSFLEFALRSDNSRQLLVGTWILFPGMSVLIRRATKHLLTLVGIWQLKVLVIGDRSDTHSFDLLSSERLLGYQLVGFVDENQIGSERKRGYFSELLRTYGASNLVLAIDVGSEAGIRIARDVVRERVPFCFVSQLRGMPVFGSEQVAFISHDAVLVSYRNKLAQPLPWAIKTLFDIVVSVLLLMLFVVPMTAIALLIKLDGGPALFPHQRVGADGRPFSCLKFRTMFTDAESILQKVLATDPQAHEQWTQTHKLAQDPRVTPIGRFLRATSLDELPQLFNVLRFEMSLVGPRPIVQQEVARYRDDIAYYYGTKPGLTGLWQVSGRSDTTYNQRVMLDSWYVRNWSVWHDIAIILKTIPVVFGRNGAR